MRFSPRRTSPPPPALRETGPPPFLLRDACTDLRAGTLFYPCAGTDWRIPVRAFLPWVRDFWFVDIRARRGSPGPYPVLDRTLPAVLQGTTIQRGVPYEVVVERTRYAAPNGRDFTVHRCTGDGYSTLRSEFRDAGRSVSVFVHRGDSPGEGGSNFRWLGSDRLVNVLETLEPGGLIVSDGSLAINELKHESPPGPPAEIVASMATFEFGGFRFRCVGYLGEYRWGTTLVWKPERLAVAGREGSEK